MNISKFLKLIMIIAVSMLALFWFASFFFIVSTEILKNIWFYIVIISYIIFLAWLFEKKELSDNLKIITGLLVFAVGLVFYIVALGPVSENSSYLQETCPECDQR